MSGESLLAAAVEGQTAPNVTPQSPQTPPTPSGGVGNPSMPVASPTPPAGGSILDRIWTPEQDTVVSPYIKMSLYGDPGAGKTTFAATAPKPLYLDTEGSTEVLDDWPELKAKCKILHPRSWNDIQEILWAYITGDPRISDRETIIIDTLTEYQKKNLDEIVISAATAAQQTKGETRNLFLPFQQDYKISTEMVRRLATSYRDLPCHLILISHRTEVKDSVGRITIRPDVTPKLASTVKAVVGLQAFLAAQVTFREDGSEEFHNYLWTRGTEQVEAKSRYRYLPTMIQDPTFDHILHYKNQGANE